MEALAEVKPDLVISVPLVIEKIYKSKVRPVLEKNGIRQMLRVPIVDQLILNKIKSELVGAFGGRFHEIIIGGAAFNRDVEAFFKKIHFPFTVGYGMTECGPIIAYDDWSTTKLYSCGKAAPNMTIRIDSGRSPRQGRQRFPRILQESGGDGRRVYGRRMVQDRRYGSA